MKKQKESARHPAKRMITRTVTFGTVVRKIAKSKSTVFYLVIVQERHGNQVSKDDLKQPAGKLRPRVGSAACIVSINRKHAVGVALAEEERLVSTIAKDSLSGRVRTGLYDSFSTRFLVNLAGQFRVQALPAKQLQVLLKSPAMVTGRVVMLSSMHDVLVDVATVVSGVAGAKAGATAVAEAVSSRLIPMLMPAALGLEGGAVATGAFAGTMLAGVVVAGAGGYLIGSAINDLINDVTPSYRGQDSYTLGDVIYDTFESDDEDSSSGGDAGAGDAGTDDSGTGGDAGTGDDDAGTGTGGDTSDEGDTSDQGDAGDEGDTGDEGDSSDEGDTSDDGDAGDDDDDQGEGGTEPSPDAESGSSLDMLFLYAATGLCRAEIQRQLSAFDLQGGSGLGVNRQRATDIHWDRMLGGFYLATILRGLEARRSQAGLRDPVNTMVMLPDSRMFINGFVCPPPLTDLVTINALAAVAS